MTIDERLEKLAERHEVMTQTVELMSREWRDRAERQGRFLGEVAEATARLLRIAQIHEQRITRLEGETD